LHNTEGKKWDMDFFGGFCGGFGDIGELKLGFTRPGHVVMCFW